MKHHRFPFLLLLGLLVAVTGVSAEWVSLDSRAATGRGVQVDLEYFSPESTVVTVAVPGFDQQIRRDSTTLYSYLDLPGAGHLYHTGAPQLPAVRKRIAVPRDAEVSLSVRVLEEITLSGYTIWPAQPQYDRGAEKPPFTMDSSLYHRSGLYPQSIATISEDAYMRDIRTVGLEITPVQYNPVTGEIRVVTQMEIELVTGQGTGYVDGPVFPVFDRIYRKNILNYDQLNVGVRSDPEPILIIAHDALISDLDSFVEWKTKKGYDVTVVGTSVSGSSSSDVQSYIQGVWATWNPKPAFIVFVGDAPQIQPLRGIGSCASDYKFTLLEGSDHVPDLFISRLSAQNASELNAQLTKIMTYEITPPEGEWLNKFAGLASSEGSGPSDEEYSQEIEARFMVKNPDSSGDRIYASMGHGAAQITAAVNDGRFWLSYFGHGSGTSWSSPSFTNSQVDALSNGDYTPFIMDVSCSNGYFDGSGDCFAERWLKGAGHGAVGMYSASTSTAWDPPAIMAWGVAYSVCGDGASIPGGDYLIGEMTYNGMMFMCDEIGYNSDSQEVMEQYVLFGDCSTLFRWDLNITPTVSHLPTTPLAPVPFEVTVTSGGSPIEGAMVCAYKPGDVHEVGYTDAAGTVSLDIEPVTVGDMIVTVSGPNLVPYEALVLVAPAGCGVVMLDREMYNCGSQAVIKVFDADLNTNPSQVEMATAEISSDSETTPETVMLVETGPDTAQFTGSIQMSDSQSGQGYLLVAHNDTVTAHYHDANCDGSPADEYDTAVMDCQGPTISNVTISAIGTDTATITWTTDEMSTTTVHYGDSTPPAMEFTVEGMTTSHEVVLEGLDVCTEYFIMVESRDAGDNVATDDNGGAYYNFTTLQLLLMLEADMDTDPGWTYTGQWAWGQPAGTSGDPDSGYTGDNVVGYNLSGNYGNSIPAYYATTQSFDCSSASQAYLSFWRWLGVESASYDHATIEVSTNGGTTWQVIWNHTGGDLVDSSWTYQEYDITAQAAGQPDVMVRWSMGPADGYLAYCGWNLDDVMVSYTAPCDVPILVYGDHSIDDSAGNSDGEINAGETISMTVTLDNQGLDATGVSATLSTSNPHVNITTASANYPNINQSSSGTSLTAYVFTVSPEAGDNETIPFTLSWTSNENSGTAVFSEMVVAPDLQYQSSAVIDTAGDVDGIIDPGESAQIMVTLSNTGSGLAQNVTAVLTSNHPEYMTISDGTASFPNIPGMASGTTIAPHFSVTAAAGTPDHTMITFTLDISSDGYTTSDTFMLEVTNSTFAVRFQWLMDTDPGWTSEGQWEWGVPQGNGGDPSSGYTGNNVVGYNLAGTYANNMAETNLTTGALDCSGMSSVELRFKRWLGVESASYDHAYVRISTDGSSWTNIWSHTGGTMEETAWSDQVFDISAYADGQATVYLRWVMGVSDGSVVKAGWNIDDVEIWAESTEPVPTPTMPPTFTPTPIPPTPTVTPPPTPTSTVPPQPTNTPDPNPTNTPEPQPTGTPEPTETPEPDRGMQLVLEGADNMMFQGGDDFYLHFYLHNTDTFDYQADTYLLLDVYGLYYCWPSWSLDMDCMYVEVPAGTSMHYDALHFSWPNGVGSADDLGFIGAMFEAGTWTMIGDVQFMNWGYR